jgi:pyrroline-5-carboxylate reductase
MAGALARGWGRPVLCTDAGSGRATDLAVQTGGRRVAGNAELAREAAFVVLCHPPPQLEAVAAEVDGRARAVVSILSGVTLRRLRSAYRSSPLLRFAVNLPVEVRAGTVCYAGADGVEPDLEAAIVERFDELGLLLQPAEADLPTIIALSGVGPAYVSLLVESQVDAAVERGLGRTEAAELVLQTLVGTAALLRRRGLDTAALRRSSVSPSGPTAAGLAVLEAAGVRGMFGAAMDAVTQVVAAAEP